MDLRAKLARLRSPAERVAFAVGEVPELQTAAALHTQAASPTSAFERHKAERIARLRTLIHEVSAREHKRASQTPEEPAEARSPFPSVQTAHGQLHLVERWLEPDHHHGRAAVRDALGAFAGTLAVLTRDPALDGLDLSRALFLDTETTGLAGGTGTVAFLIGLAHFHDGVLLIEQLIVPELGAEVPALARLAERIAAASCVISYNGKSFDWPLLRTRFVMSRLPVPALPAHIDLLHAARSLWKRRFDSLRLGEIEREVLAFEREHDISGAEIPARYFQYLRDGVRARLVPVLEHNQHDLIALAALLGALITRLQSIETAADARDALAFGQLALRIRATDCALSCARAARTASAGGDAEPAALLLESAVRRQLGDHGHAAELIEAALVGIADQQQRSVWHLALAKLYEHELMQLRQALRHARHTELAEGCVAHGRRLGRLHRRLLRDQATDRSQT